MPSAAPPDRPTLSQVRPAEAAQRAVEDRLRGCSAYTWAVNGRFKGGYITRHYGAPADNVHAIQLEMCQSTYMDETYPYGYREDLAGKVIPVVESLVQAALRQTGARRR